MSREVRMVPKDWKHPLNEKGRLDPLDEGYDKSLAEWFEGREKWNAGLSEDWSKSNDSGKVWKPKEADEAGTWEDWYGKKPNKKDYMPEFEAGTATYLMMYETCTEGTPISPAFATPEGLARWLADTGASAFADMTATYEQWLKTCKAGYAPSAVFTTETGMISGVEATKLLK